MWWTTSILLVNQISTFSLDKYNTYEEIDEWTEQEGGRIIATSKNGRNIRVVEKSSSHQSAKTIMVDCGKGARDWISITFCLNLINELANSDSDLDKISWIILPLLNPDGYSYTWTNDRTWQKNRGPTENNFCTGTDLTRNYPSNWGIGGSTNPCSNEYIGSQESSEIETTAHIAQIKELLSTRQSCHKFYKYFNPYSGALI